MEGVLGICTGYGYFQKKTRGRRVFYTPLCYFTTELANPILFHWAPGEQAAILSYLEHCRGCDK